MSVSAVGSALVPVKTADQVAAASPAQDSDNQSTAVSAPVQAAPAPGTGQLVDKTV
ncbi:MAG TPA: hypothetical protein VK281_03970 [Xanthobacteraceae bacterium]|nr:hypothetical protein [Xanthobacteraceae bacterium]